MNRTISLPLAMRAVNLALFCFAAYSVAMSFREHKHASKRSKVLSFAPMLTAILLAVVGILTGISLLPAEGTWLLCPFNCLFLYFVCIAANQNVSWDAQGFTYRTGFRRNKQYAFSDIRRIKKNSTGITGDLRFWAGKRLIILDPLLLDRYGFESAYNAWRSRNGLVSFQMEAEQRWREKYLQHGPFRRNLDRIPGGLGKLIILLCGGGLMAGVGIWGIHAIQAGDIAGLTAGILLLLVGFILPLLFIYGVSTMNKKALRMFVKSKIRPAPDQSVKRYRPKK